jgi:hypothetical protein
MPDPGTGWVLHVRRLAVHRDGEKARTYGSYRAFLNGAPIDGLHGHACECLGPGDNQHEGNGKRIAAGRYPLWTQFGNLYRTVGYADEEGLPGTPHMPGIRLENTGKRTDILIHPAYPPNLYLSSVGCLNLTGPVSATTDMAYGDSRARVIALINSLHAFAPGAFASIENTPIPNASAVIDGEPAE